VPEQIQSLITNLKGFGVRRLALMGGIAALVMAVIGVASVYLNRPAYETLYVGLERSDVNQIGLVLGDAGIGFDVGADGTLSGGREFAVCTVGLFDGFRLDSDGRIWTSAGDGVHCYHPDGTLIGKVKVPEVVANVCFGGPKRNILYICGTTSLYSVRLMVNGARTY